MPAAPTLDSLTGLRGLAALWVLAYHAWSIPGGYLGVDLFFALSGFVLALNYGDAALHASPRRYGQFLGKRLARLYPAHVCALLLTLACVAILAPFGRSLHRPTEFSIESWWASLLMVQAWQFPVPGVWNVPAWSISAEWAAYLLFPLLVLPIRRLQDARRVMLAIVFVYVGLAFAIHRFWVPGTMAFGMWRVAAGFTAGLLLHRLWELRGGARHARAGRAEGARSADGGPPWRWLLAFIGGATVWELAFGAHAALPWFPLLACGVIYSLAVSGAPLLCTPIALALGRLSYSLYLVNWPIIELCQRLARLSRSTLPDALVTAIGAVVALFVAHLVHRYVEEPARRGLAQRWLRREPLPS
jgi:peptidoglycan/LPS O-acetylase OafA/YrhL